MAGMFHGMSATLEVQTITMDAPRQITPKSLPKLEQKKTFAEEVVASDLPADVKDLFTTNLEDTAYILKKDMPNEVQIAVVKFLNRVGWPDEINPSDFIYQFVMPDLLELILETQPQALNSDNLSNLISDLYEDEEAEALLIVLGNWMAEMHKRLGVHYTEEKALHLLNDMATSSEIWEMPVERIVPHFRRTLTLLLLGFYKTWPNERFCEHVIAAARQARRLANVSEGLQATKDLTPRTLMRNAGRFFEH